MNIVLIGYGKMGKEIERIACDKGHSIIGSFSKSRLMSTDKISNADVCIDFSSADAVIQNVTICAQAQKPIVIGTTGWNTHLEKIKTIVHEKNIGLLYASNFSIGVNVFMKIVETAGTFFNHFEDYDVALQEIHHHQKADSPSGTALSIAEILLRQINRKKSILTAKTEGKISPEQLHVTSIRTGSVPGTHSVLFDSPADSIELIHTARNRSGFAFGAVLAAEWICNKKGLYTLSDMLNL
ncbi:4-hydroxy-tetrahydrodipicolinate reductase [bacterium]|nr:4-hydroxy-tetrahydrodipicolinate reductase [bacterium]